MATAFAPSVSRRQVLFLGDAPPDGPFLERGLSLAAFGSGIETMRWSRALLVRIDNDIAIDKDELTLARDHGLQVFVVATNDEDQRDAITQLATFGLQQAVTLRTSVPWKDIAEQCRNHDPKSGIGDVEIIGDCDEEDAFLLRRAFAD